MYKKITVKTNNNICSVFIEPNSIIKNLNLIVAKKEKNVFLIDKKVFYIFKKLKNYKKQNYLLINCSEKLKDLKNYSTILEKILKFNIDRNTNIIAIGGGTLGDLSGFIASTILRGVNFILFPTTLLSQVDSSIGGKNGINTHSGKNLVGTFYQPKLVFIDPKILTTLPKREILSGYAEIVKHGIIEDKKFFQWLDKNCNNILKLDERFLSEAIYRSIKIKIKYVLKDEKEKLDNNNSRAILNFGHTFGHALEAYYKYNKKLTHGEAISIGMIISAKLSVEINNLSLSDFNKIKNHFKQINLPISDSKMYDKKIFKIIEKDKKSTNSKINFVLLKKIGNAILGKNISIKRIKQLLNK